MEKRWAPDLAPIDYFLFTNLKNWLGRTTFGSIDELIAQTNSYFADPKKFCYLEVVKKKGETLGEVDGDVGNYVKKYKIVVVKPLACKKSRTYRPTLVIHRNGYNL